MFPRGGIAAGPCGPRAVVRGAPWGMDPRALPLAQLVESSHTTPRLSLAGDSPAYGGGL